jgi:transposase
MYIAKAYFLMGLSIRKIAAKHHISIYRIRETLKKVQELVELVNSNKKSNQKKQTA